MDLKLKKMVDQIDDDLLDQIIDRCEKSMVSKFKKPDPEPEEVEVSNESDDSSESDEQKSGLAEADIDELMEMLKKKG